LGDWLNWDRKTMIWALCIYGFVASVLPVWMLLCPRDYISSFLKIGTILLLVVGVCLANPVLPCPAINPVFSESGPTFDGSIFPFMFICIMCGAISGFHSLVASGTTPKMVDKESHIPLIGYGAMLIEGLVGVVALLTAASMPVELYYDINVSHEKRDKWQEPIEQLKREFGAAQQGEKQRLGVDNLAHLRVETANLAEMEQLVGGETLRGRTGGAVTLAVGMSRILTQACALLIDPANTTWLVKYWYHFAIMFEALFILTTIDTGTRIARFLFQETLGQVFPIFGKTDWLPGAVLGTGVVTAGWGLLVSTGSISTIWPMFGIANQLLAALALCLVTTLLFNAGRGRYAWVTLLPLVFVTTTTMTAGAVLLPKFIASEKWLNFVLTIFVLASVGFILVWAAARWLGIASRRIPAKP
jgi:carbon starvation protein